MKKRIYIYELDCYKAASEEQLQRMRISPERYFNLEGLPSGEITEKLEEFIWERGKMLAPSSMASEVTYYNNIREFLIDRKIQNLDSKEEKIIRMLKSWMLEQGYALSSKKYRPAYDKVGIESPGIVRHMKKILKFLEEEDDRDEQEKDIWTLKNFDFPIQGNPILNTETINFTKIVQPDIREEVKKVIFMHLKYSPLGTIHSEMTAVKRFSKFLKRKYLDIQSLQDLERMHIEEYLIYLQTEAHDRKNYRSDLYALRRVIEDVGNLYERQYMKYDKMVAITQAESQRKMNIAKNTISDMLKNMERITVAELVKRTGFSRGFFYKNELIRREMDDAIHRQEAIFKNRHPVTMDRKLENSVIDLKIELLKAKAENEKLLEQNQDLIRKNEQLCQQVDKLQKQIGKKQISLLKRL